MERLLTSVMMRGHLAGSIDIQLEPQLQPEELEHPQSPFMMTVGWLFV